jgi:hypothetical protein
MKMTVFWDVLLCSLVMMVAVSTSETSVNFYQTTWHNIPEDTQLHLTVVGTGREDKSSIVFFPS